MAKFPKLFPGLVSGFIGFSLVLVIGCGEKKSEQLTPEKISFTKEGTLTILSAVGDTLKSTLDIEFAETDYEIQTGLMYREKMGETQGMLFLFPSEAPHSFYMKNTLIPLDLLFIRSDSSIAKIARNARPLDESSIPSGEPIQFVLEVNAGMSSQWGIQEGDKVYWHR